MNACRPATEAGAVVNLNLVSYKGSSNANKEASWACPGVGGSAGNEAGWRWCRSHRRCSEVLKGNQKTGRVMFIAMSLMKLQTRGKTMPHSPQCKNMLEC